MPDLHEFHICLAHGWGIQESQNLNSNPLHLSSAGHNLPLPELILSKGNHPVLPNPTLFTHLTTTTPDSVSATAPPTTGQCAAHLQLLEAIYDLRTQVTSTERLNASLGIKPGRRKVWKKQWAGRRWRGRPNRYEVMIKDLTFPERSRRKWSLFLDLAVVRFELWAPEIEGIMRSSSSTPSLAVLPHIPPLGRYPLPFVTISCCYRFLDAYLSCLYLDVLMVWHALLLNPSDYRDYCQQRKLEYLSFVEFPWLRIVSQPSS